MLNQHGEARQPQQQKKQPMTNARVFSLIGEDADTTLGDETTLQAQV